MLGTPRSGSSPASSRTGRPATPCVALAGLALLAALHGAPLAAQGGTLCVEPPIQRTPPQHSGSSGSPPCAGVLSLDLNAAGICAGIGVGHRGWIQRWFRDPASPITTGLTDAIEFTVCP